MGGGAAQLMNPKHVNGKGSPYSTAERTIPELIPVVEWWGAGVVICLERGADLHNGPADATATHCLLLQ